MEELTLKDLHDAYQELEDYAYHAGLKQKLSAKTTAIAMRVISERMQDVIYEMQIDE